VPRRPSASRDAEGGSVRISPTDVDPLASLGLSKVAVELAGRRWLIPAVDASVWLRILLAEDLDVEEIFPGLCGPDVIVEVNQLIIEGSITMAEMQDTMFDVIEAASGRRWWITLRLCRTLRSTWDRVGGELASRGVTPFGVSLSYWLDGAYATFLRLLADGDPKNAGRFAQQLVQPPPGLAKANFDQDAAAASFRAAMNRGRQAR
jgi:hypothetical protein